MKNRFQGVIIGIVISMFILTPLMGHAQGWLQTIQVEFNKVNLSVNGKKIDADNILYNGTTYVPIRSVADALGKEVGWDEGTNTASIDDKNRSTTSQQNTEVYNIEPAKTNFKLFVNGSELSLDLPPVEKGNNFLVPIRVLSESMNLVVSWDESSKQITFKQKQSNNVLKMVINSNDYNFNDKKYTLAVSPIIYNDRTIVPIKEVVESFGGTLEVDKSAARINISYSTINSNKNSLTLEYSELNKDYKSKSGLTIRVNSISKSEDVGSIKYTINYTLKNETTDKKIDEGTFKMHFESGEPESQYGFFGTLFPDEKKEQSYTFKILKTQKPKLVEYEADFFSKTPESDTLKWKCE